MGCKSNKELNLSRPTLAFNFLPKTVMTNQIKKIGIGNGSRVRRSQNCAIALGKVVNDTGVCAPIFNIEDSKSGVLTQLNKVATRTSTCTGCIFGAGKNAG
jgi:hypothetical protein